MAKNVRVSHHKIGLTPAPAPENCDEPGREVLFEQPVLQTLQMFVGEILCWIPVFLNRAHRGSAEVAEQAPLLGKKSINTVRESFVLSLPAVCDFTATTLLNVGLLYTPVSIYQMTRGSVILFVGLFSVTALHKTITKLEWLSLFVVVFGVFIVGLSGSIESGEELIQVEKGNVVFGMLIIVLGIMCNAAQFVIEESILANLEVSPLRLVGYEGIYGALATTIFMVFGQAFMHKSSKDAWDMVYALQLMFTHSRVLLSSLLIMLCISSFNFFGISLTHRLNATARSTIDTSRTLLVWLVSLSIGWEQFRALQLVGFSLLLYGTLVFNGVIELEKSRFVPQWLKQRSKDPLITIEEPIERF
ncbi:hypothetical protein KL905_003666 [Ogataea polymorpha]|nr:hypothetical protein KL908_003606 [Ogataea polymorpha]KAG7919801.1 hypothetical protein KL905_003666 [Ogataea polymorpha]